jgi:hypothetical protein
MNAFKVFNQIKVIIMILFFGLNVFIIVYYILWPSKYETKHNLSINFDAQTYDIHDFNIELNINRLNRLFKIIQSKEKSYAKIFDKLNILQFEKIIDKTFYSEKDNWLYSFKKEIDENFEIENGQVGVKEKYVDELSEMSKNYSFYYMHNELPSKKIEKVLYLNFYKI